VPTTEEKNRTPAEKLGKDLDFDHRIADTAKIKETGVESESDYRGMKRLTLFVAIIFMLITATAIYLDGLIAKRYFAYGDENLYTVRVDRNKEQRELARATQAGNDSFRVEEWRTGLAKVLSGKEFRLMDPRIITIKPTSTDKEYAHFTSSYGIPLALIGGVAIFTLYSTWRTYRLRRRISKLVAHSSVLTEVGSVEGNTP